MRYFSQMKSLIKHVMVLITILSISFPFVQFNSSSYYQNTYIKLTSEPYRELQSVTYQVEVNFFLTHNYPTNSDYWFKFSRFDNRAPNSILTKDLPPFQESNLILCKIAGSASIPYVSIDKFNNTYDVFNNTLFSGQSIMLRQKYNIKLNEISFSDIDYSKIEPYDNSSVIQWKLCWCCMVTLVV